MTARDDLRVARMSRGHSQLSLAKAADVSRETVRRAEAGESIRPTTARKLAEPLGMTIGEILGLEKAA